jgi:hypothetical protein
MIISDCSCGNRCMAGLDKCASCLALERKAARVKPSDNAKPINQFSKKRGKYNQRYLSRLKTWKRGKKCAATFPHDCYGDLTVHHMYSRSVDEYHDEWAEENDVPYLNDERLWLPVCLNAHQYITDNPKFAYENQYSFKRIADKIFHRS